MQSEQVAVEGVFRGTQASEQRTIAEQLRSLGETNLTREQELVCRRLAIGQSEILVESINILTQESGLDKLLVHALKVVKQQRQEDQPPLSECS